MNKAVYCSFKVCTVLSSSTSAVSHHHIIVCQSFKPLLDSLIFGARVQTKKQQTNWWTKFQWTFSRPCTWTFSVTMITFPVLQTKGKEKENTQLLMVTINFYIISLNKDTISTNIRKWIQKIHICNIIYLVTPTIWNDGLTY